MREKLPNRREQVGDTFRWPPDATHRTHVAVGHSQGKILECFLRGGGTARSERDYLLDDIGVLISRLLQFGDSLESIASGLGRSPDGKPMSVVGAGLDKMVELEHSLTARSQK